MKCSKIRELLNQFAPEKYAEGWDNSGLLLGRMDKEIQKVTVVLDITEAVIDFAAENGVDMILSHHPMLFAPVKRITDEDFMGKRILTLLNHDICCYAMHTNFDSVPGGMADLVASELPFAGWEPLDDVYEFEMSDGSVKMAGIGCVGDLKEPMSVEEIAQLVKEKFQLEGVTAFAEDPKKKITRLAICPGSGKSTVGAALQKGAEVLLTGDMGHHAGIDAVAEGLGIIDAGHYGLEQVFIPFMEQWVKEHTEVEVISMKSANPITFY